MERLSAAYAREIGALCKTFDMTACPEQFDPLHLGNSVLELHGPEVKLQITRDHGRVFFDMKPAGPECEWIWLSRIFSHLGIAFEPAPVGLVHETVDRIVENAGRIRGYVMSLV
jgi:hypothetical protein